MRLEDDPAAERVRRRDRADDDPVAAAREHRPLEPQLPEPVAERRQPRRRLARAVVDVDAHRVVGVAQVERRVEDRARRDGARGGEDVAAPDRAAVDPGEVQRDALARLGALDGLVVDLDAAHAHGHRRAAGA